MPLAKDWFDVNTSITTRNGDRFEVVAAGDLSKSDLSRLQPGDIISNGTHVGIYAPVLYTSGEDGVPGYSDRQIRNLGDDSSLARGEQWVQPRTVSAATPNERNMLSPSPTQPFFGGVTWNTWGFRGDKHDDNVVVRRLVKP